MPAFVLEIPELRASTSPVQIKSHYTTQKTKPSFDFDQYLLASSPPGFGVFDLGQKQPTRYDHLTPAYQKGNSAQCRNASSKKSKPTSQVVDHISTNAPPHSPSTTTAPHSYLTKTATTEPKKGKKVSFADDVGLSLEQIKYFSETPDMPPPVIKTSQMLRSAKVSLLQANDDLPSLAKMATFNPVLVPGFPMPVSDYATFNEKLDRDCVALMSIYAVSSSTLMGTVKVKNLGFEKTVYVRSTFDSWKTFVDIPCRYKSNYYSGGYEEFAFTINTPSDLDRSAASQFAVCFKCNGREYWDNNGGTNYSLLVSTGSTTKQAAKDSRSLTKTRETLDLSWTGFADCRERRTFGPYW